MANRLTDITTRTGDDGTTGLADGSRLAKNAARIEALGAVDELNAAMGCLLAEPLAEEVHVLLESVQHRLFDLGAELALPGSTRLPEDAVAALEASIEPWNARLGPLREFILPGGSRAGAAAHFARTVCRRAERCLVTLERVEPVSPMALRYLNRLSDLLFVAARVINRHQGAAEVFWRA